MLARVARSSALRRSARALLRSISYRPHEKVYVTSRGVVEGHKVVEELGMVVGSHSRARNLGYDLITYFRSLLGGQLNAYSTLAERSSAGAMQHMVKQAEVC